MLSKVKEELSKVWESFKGWPTPDKIVLGLVIVCVLALVAVAC